MSGTCSSHANTMKCVRNLWKCVVHHQGWMSQPGTGVIGVSPDKVVVQNTGVPLRENIYKTTCICKKGLSYLFSISMLTSFGLFQNLSSNESIIVTLEYTLLKCVKLLDHLSDLHGPLINWISSGTSLGESTGPDNNYYLHLCAQ